MLGASLIPPLLLRTYSHGPPVSYSNKVNNLHFLSNFLVINGYQIFLNLKFYINTCVNNLNIWKFQRCKERKKPPIIVIFHTLLEIRGSWSLSSFQPQHLGVRST